MQCEVIWFLCTDLNLFKSIGSFVLGTNTLFLVRLCGNPFLTNGFHVAACADYGNVHRGEIICASMFLVICLCLTLFDYTSQYAVLYIWSLSLTPDV